METKNDKAGSVTTRRYLLGAGSTSPAKKESGATYTTRPGSPIIANHPQTLPPYVHGTLTKVGFRFNNSEARSEGMRMRESGGALPDVADVKFDMIIADAIDDFKCLFDGKSPGVTFGEVDRVGHFDFEIRSNKVTTTNFLQVAHALARLGLPQVAADLLARAFLHFGKPEEKEKLLVGYVGIANHYTGVTPPGSCLKDAVVNQLLNLPIKDEIKQRALAKLIEITPREIEELRLKIDLGLAKCLDVRTKYVLDPGLKYCNSLAQPLVEFFEFTKGQDRPGFPHHLAVYFQDLANEIVATLDYLADFDEENDITPSAAATSLEYCRNINRKSGELPQFTPREIAQLKDKIVQAEKECDAVGVVYAANLNTEFCNTLAQSLVDLFEFAKKQGRPGLPPDFAVRLEKFANAILGTLKNLEMLDQEKGITGAAAKSLELCLDINKQYREFPQLAFGNDNAVKDSYDKIKEAGFELIPGRTGCEFGRKLDKPIVEEDVGLLLKHVKLLAANIMRRYSPEVEAILKYLHKEAPQAVNSALIQYIFEVRGQSMVQAFKREDWILHQLFFPADFPAAAREPNSEVGEAKPKKPEFDWEQEIIAAAGDKNREFLDVCEVALKKLDLARCNDVIANLEKHFKPEHPLVIELKLVCLENVNLKMTDRITRLMDMMPVIRERIINGTLSVAHGSLSRVYREALMSGDPDILAQLGAPDFREGFPEAFPKAYLNACQAFRDGADFDAQFTALFELLKPVDRKKSLNSLTILAFHVAKTLIETQMQKPVDNGALAGAADPASNANAWITPQNAKRVARILGRGIELLKDMSVSFSFELGKELFGANANTVENASTHELLLAALITQAKEISLYHHNRGFAQPVHVVNALVVVLAGVAHASSVSAATRLHAKALDAFESERSMFQDKHAAWAGGLKAAISLGFAKICLQLGDIQLCLEHFHLAGQSIHFLKREDENLAFLKVLHHEIELLKKQIQVFKPTTYVNEQDVVALRELTSLASQKGLLPFVPLFERVQAWFQGEDQ